MINTFYIDHLEKPIVISSLKNFVPPMAKPAAKLTTKPLNAIKKKRGQLAKASVKQIREV